MPQVQIRSRNFVPDPLDPEGVKQSLAVVYSTGDRSPRQIIVPGEKPTEAQIAEAIRQDLAGRAAEPPPTLEV